VVQHVSWPLAMIASVIGCRAAIRAEIPELIVIAVLATGSFGLAWALENILPFRPGQRDPDQDRLDHMNVVMTELVAQGAFRSFLWIAGLVLGAELSRRPELGLWGLMGLDGLPWIVEFAIAMVLLDLPLYWQHRWMHTMPGLWAVHTVHHSPRRLAAICGVRNHVLSPILTATVSLAFGALGPSTDIFVAVHGWIVVKGWLQHANSDLRTPGLDLIFPTPRVHRFHHSSDPTESATNFGILTNVWDHMPWHRLPLIGRHMAWQRSSYQVPAGHLAPAAHGSELPIRSEDGRTRTIWWMHTTHPIRVWRSLPSVQAAVTWAGWPLGVGGAVALAAQLVSVGVAPGLVAGITAAGGIAWAAILQVLHPMSSDTHPSTPEEDGGWRLDLLHLGLSEGVAHAAAQGILGAMGLWLTHALSLSGWNGPWNMLGISEWPVLLQLALAMVILDLALYWQHRLFHEVPQLWATHRVHHAVRSYGPTRAARHHPLSPLVTTAIWMGFSLLGAPLVVFAMAQAFAATNGALQHCGAHLRIGRLDRVFAGPAIHRWHHARDLRDRNFGPNLTVWDQVPWHRLPVLRRVLCIRHTTFYRGAEPGPCHIGLEETLMPVSASSLETWAHQVYAPIKPIARTLLQVLSFPLIVTGIGVGAFTAITMGVPVPGVIIPVLLGVAGLNLLLERTIPYRSDWATDRAETWTDLIHLLLSGLAPHVLVAGLISLAASITGTGLTSWVGEFGFWHRAGLAELPVVIQVGAAILLLDLCLYWHHRVMHEVPSLWPIHEVHHAPDTMTGTRVLRNHPIGPLLTNFFVVVLGALGMEPAVFVTAQAVSLTVGILQHTNADLRLGFLDQVFCGPRMHRWHHSAAEAEWDHNFGSITTLWDRVPWHLSPLRPLLRLKRASLLLPDGREAPEALGITTPMAVEAFHPPLHRWARHVRHPFQRHDAA